MTPGLREWAAARGFDVAWGPAGALDAVRADLEGRRRAGELDAAFARDILTFDFGGRRPDTARWRVLVLAMPRPAHAVSFTLNGRRVETVLPPTYERYRPTFEAVRKELLAGPLAGALVETLDAPLKPLAARLGLVRYGRNNLAYTESAGSYHQLLGYLTDANLAVAARWEPAEAVLLDECAGCALCEALCPTGAIGGERVLLHAERCLTLANESVGDWPAWVPPAAHQCLIGCLACQRMCPANPPLQIVDTSVVFGEEETGALLADGGHDGPAWDAIRRKLQELGQPRVEELLGRNLRALLRVQGDAPRSGTLRRRAT